MENRMMHAGDEDYGDDVTCGIFPDDLPTSELFDDEDLADVPSDAEEFAKRLNTLEQRTRPEDYDLQHEGEDQTR
jgi:hypothetical protein